VDEKGKNQQAAKPGKICKGWSKREKQRKSREDLERKKTSGRPSLGSFFLL